LTHHTVIAPVAYQKLDFHSSHYVHLKLIRFFTMYATKLQPNLIMNFLNTVADMLHRENAGLFKGTAPKF
jgi:hypothetical protein